jgi:polyhydroxybutyrate depolymerase
LGTAPVDASVPTDGRNPADSSSPTDSTGPIDSSNPTDSTGPLDSTSPTDSSSGLDAGLDDAYPPWDGPPPVLDGGLSSGCGLMPRDQAGGAQVTFNAGPAADGTRSYYLSRQSSYDPTKPHRLILGYPGTDWTGKMIQPYFNLETDNREDEIFVYPDPLWRTFPPPWSEDAGGWLLGPNAGPAAGDQDLAYTRSLLADVEANYCIDTSKIFVVGHSWGGDMAHVVSCFLGDLVRASAPAAANNPYWFEGADGGINIACVGQPAVWTFFGSGDDWFGTQDAGGQQAYPGQFGDECRDFWLGEAHCSGVDASTTLPYGSGMECYDYAGCARPTRYCLYGPATAHQIPPYYAQAVMAFFRSF